MSDEAREIHPLKFFKELQQGEGKQMDFRPKPEVDRTKEVETGEVQAAKKSPRRHRL